MRAKDGRIEEGHYLRKRAAPGGRAVAWGSVLVRWVAGRGCWGGVGVVELRLTNAYQNFTDFFSARRVEMGTPKRPSDFPEMLPKSYSQMPKI